MKTKTIIQMATALAVACSVLLGYVIFRWDEKPNVINGSTAGLTNLQLMHINGGNTLRGSITGLPKIERLGVSTNNAWRK